MGKIAVIKTGGKQYLVKENSLLTVDLLDFPEKEKINLEALAFFDEEGKNLELGTPSLKKTVEAEVIEHLKGDKIRVAKFKSKVRYRKVKGFRPRLTKIKITKI